MKENLGYVWEWGRLSFHLASVVVRVGDRGQEWGEKNVYRTDVHL